MALIEMSASRTQQLINTKPLDTAADFLVDEWLVSPSLNRIGKNGKTVKLDPGAMDLLVMLAASPGNVVSKAQIAEALWHGRPVEDTQVYKRVGQLRSAFDDGDVCAQIIETIPKRGYRLVATVRGGDATADRRTSTPRPNRGPRNHRAVLAIGAMLVALAIIVLMPHGQDAAPSARLAAATVTERPVALAILPFENVSPNPNDAYFANGLHREIVNRLSQVDDLQVIARSSVLQYADSVQPISRIARELGVDAILEGSVRYDSHRVRMILQLIDSDSNTLEWARTFDREFTDVFAVQAEIAEQVALALESELSPVEQERISRAPTASAAAYALYLRAMTSAGNISPSGVGLNDELHRYLDEALALDPQFALAHAVKALDYAQSMSRSFRLQDAKRREEWQRSAIEHAERALSLNPRMGAAHAAVGWIESFNNNWRAAEIAFEKALEASPNNRDVLIDFAFFMSRIGRHAESIDLAQRVAAIDPVFAPDLLGYIYWHAGQLDAAADTIRAAVDLAPATRYLDLAEIETIRGNYDVARQNLEADATVAQAEMPQPIDLAIRTYLYGRLGQQEDAARVFRQLEELATRQSIGAGNWALACLGLGDYQRALSWLIDASTDRTVGPGWITLLEIAQNHYQDPALEQQAFRDVRRLLGFKR